MALPTAPCTRCRSLVVYGERRCRACGEAFNYGANAPPEPTAAQLQEALATADLGFDAVHTSPGSPAAAAHYQAEQSNQARAQSLPDGAPIQDPGSGLTLTPLPAEPAPEPPRSRDPMIDTGRAEAVGEVQTDDVPGLIDSRLFGAMVPEHVQVEKMPDLETAEAPVGDVEADESLSGWLDTGRFEEAPAAALQTESVPGLIDSRLFGAMVPEDVPVQALDGIERQTNVSSRGGGGGPGVDLGETVHCADCGQARRAAVEICPDCGSRRLR